MRIHNKQLTQTGQDVFHKDSEVICDIIAPRLAEMSSKNENLLYDFALNNAKYNNYNEVVRDAFINGLNSIVTEQRENRP